ncbi:MAG: DNA adenine methylase [Bacteroidales bacterium]|nr:DNA adenine methylase [Bacteroidales bacterium]
MFRYIGNKTKLLPQILQKVRTLIGGEGTVADIMAGTGCVSRALRNAGYSVIASDVMTYSYHHLIATLMLSKSPSFRGLSTEVARGNASPYCSVLEWLNNLPPRKGFFYREYSSAGKPKNGAPARKYFTPDNAARIDAIRSQIEWWKADGRLTTHEDSLLKHTLILAANDVANISGTYGYFLSSYKKNAQEKMVLSPIEFERGNSSGHQVLQGFAEDLSRHISADLCYMDPPYMKRQYAANYHILETLACGDSPELIGKSGLRDWWGQHSKLCTKTRGLQAFRQIITNMDCPNFLVSYSEDGLFSLEELENLFSEFGDVSVERIVYNRFRSNDSALAKQLNEYLITIER